MAVTSLKLGLTVSPPDNALSSVTLKVRASPSSALASAIVTAGASSSVMVPVAVSVGVTVVEVPETVKLTVKLSSASNNSSSVVATVKVCSSPAVPVKLRAAVFAV